LLGLDNPAGYLSQPLIIFLNRSHSAYIL